MSHSAITSAKINYQGRTSKTVEESTFNRPKTGSFARSLVYALPTGIALWAVGIYYAVRLLS
jgi:hypothetical protein